ncbi:hypothetical protein B566_EDAN019026 [Ephemera danica]|nr:hypothetical protein B566_EDAN019026 [Ephemera danica]
MPRFGGPATMMRLPTATSAAGLDAAFIGVPFDIGTSHRPGTRFGPRQIRAESSLIRPYNMATGAAPFDSLQVADLGDVAINTFNLADSIAIIERHFRDILDQACIPLTLGGDHTIALPILRAMARRHGPVGLIHIDAHADVNEHMFGEQIAHGTPFRRAVEEGLLCCDKVWQIGLRGSGYAADDFDWPRQQGFTVVPAHEIWWQSLVPLMNDIRARMGTTPVYLSFDIDGIDPAYAGGTGTPEIGGLTVPQALEIILSCEAFIYCKKTICAAMKKFSVPPIPADEATPLVQTLVAMIEALVEENQRQAETIQQMRDEIAVLKGEKARPKFTSSKMDDKTDKVGEDDTEASKKKKRPGAEKRSKTAELTIHEERVIAPDRVVPAGSRFKGYRNFVVQGLVIRAHTIRYRLECWQTPEGELLSGRLPAALQGRHFDPVLCGYIVYQHHHCQVTQPLLREQLTEWGIDISAGQIEALLSTGKASFHDEKNALLHVGLDVSQSITVDDSGARHQGKNGYVTQIGNEFFAWFASTGSKSRINFLECLHAGATTYRMDEAALTYMTEQGLSEAIRQRLYQATPTEIGDADHWRRHLAALNIKDERHVRIATEGALLGSLLEKGFNPELAIISDGAGQFAILLHGLCWIHAERLVHKLIPMNDLQRAAIASVREQIWSFYADLKAYKTQPDTTQIKQLEDRFTAIFTQRTTFATLDRLLLRLHRHKDELLLVLRRPDIPLHTNGSETDIRDYVKKRKPGGQFGAVTGGQYRPQCVFSVGFAKAFGLHHQMQIMIAQHDGGRTAQSFDKTQDFKGFRAAIDQIAHQPELVGSRIESDMIEQSVRHGRSGAVFEHHGRYRAQGCRFGGLVIGYPAAQITADFGVGFWRWILDPAKELVQPAVGNRARPCHPYLGVVRRATLFFSG